MSPLIEVGGRPVWHEVHGSGEPVVLVHGGVVGADSWRAQTDALVAAGYRVFLPERRGHGRTPDVDEPLGYTDMAARTVHYLDQVVRSPAPLIGWSDGAVVALLVALRRPDLVTRLVLIGQYYNASGRIEGGIVDTVTSDPGVREYLRGEALAAQPGLDFDRFFDAIVAMWQAEPELDLAELAGVRVPTLVVQGDRDDVTVAHSLDVVAALPDARLAVLPGTHMLPIESPDCVNPLLLSFLRGGAGKAD